MIIQSSTINMASERFQTKGTAYNHTETLTQQGTGAVNINTTAYSIHATEHNHVSFLDTYTKALQDSEQNTPMPSEQYTKPGSGNVRFGNGNIGLESYHVQLRKQIEEFMERIKQQLLGTIFSFKNRSAMQNSYGFSAVISSSSTSIVNISSSANQMVWERQTVVSNSYHEAEYTTFVSKGIVNTADGRELTFDIALEMSREFMASAELISNDTIMILTDPLIINLDGNPTYISDQKWQFDINGDGELNTISMLGKGSGYLALDINGDGVINDGSELFGTKSGNGFLDLSAYDEDGNGWIDENDSVFSMLKIWVKDDSGQDKLLSLKDCDIGAIYLGNVSTEYSHTSLTSNTLNAQVRQTGLYLKESGGVGTMQQVDFAC